MKGLRLKKALIMLLALALIVTCVPMYMSGEQASADTATDEVVKLYFSRKEIRSLEYGNVPSDGTYRVKNNGPDSQGTKEVYIRYDLSDAVNSIDKVLRTRNGNKNDYAGYEIVGYGFGFRAQNSVSSKTSTIRVSAKNMAPDTQFASWKWETRPTGFVALSDEPSITPEDWGATVDTYFGYGSGIPEGVYSDWDLGLVCDRAMYQANNQLVFKIEEVGNSEDNEINIAPYSLMPFNVYVRPIKKEIKSMSIAKEPTNLKAYYLVGEEVDLTGGELEVIYEDDSSDIIAMDSEEVMVTESALTGGKRIFLNYEGRQCSLDVAYDGIKSASIVGNVKTTYNRGESFNPETGSLKVLFKSGREDTIPMTDSRVTIDAAVLQGWNRTGKINFTFNAGEDYYPATATVSKDVNLNKITKTLRLYAVEANHARKGGNCVGVSRVANAAIQVKNYNNNTVEAYLVMDLSEVDYEARLHDGLVIKSAKLNFQAKGYGTNTKTSRRLQVYKTKQEKSVEYVYNNGVALSWAKRPGLGSAIGSNACVNKDQIRSLTWDVSDYVKERYKAGKGQVTFGFGLTQADNGKQVNILSAYDSSKTYLEVVVEY